CVNCKELTKKNEIVVRVEKEVFAKKKMRLNYLVGTMIELPRAALVADEIAKEAQFFSFGTNDLTQTTFGFSRDDINKFLPSYLAEGILKQDPFAVLDREGVGQLVRMATERGRKSRSNLKVGICGEHGGDPSSVEFCHQLGLDYVSCSPYRVPIARLAAAQAVLTKTDTDMTAGKRLTQRATRPARRDGRTAPQQQKSHRRSRPHRARQIR